MLVSSANTYEGVLGGFAGGTLGVIVFPFAKAKTRRLAKNKKDVGFHIWPYVGLISFYRISGGLDYTYSGCKRTSLTN